MSHGPLFVTLGRSSSSTSSSRVHSHIQENLRYCGNTHAYLLAELTRFWLLLSRACGIAKILLSHRRFWDYSTEQ